MGSRHKELTEPLAVYKRLAASSYCRQKTIYKLSAGRQQQISSGGRHYEQGQIRAR